MKLTVNEALADAGYIRWFFRSPVAQKYLESRTLATGVPHINLGILKNHPILLPPLAEQQRIAAILDKADDVRRKRKMAVDLAEELLRAAFLEMFGDPITNPKGWPTADLGRLVSEMRYGTSQKCIEEASAGSLPVLRIPNISHERILWEDLKFAALDQVEVERLLLKPGDLLVVRSNGNPEYIGRCAVFRDPRRTLYASYLIRVRFSGDNESLPEFIQTQLSMPSYRRRLISEARTTAGNYNISTEGLRRLRLILAPSELQRKFADFKKQVRTTCNRQDKALAESSDLFKSIIHRAFRGEL